ncbi:MAG: hypothetical protein J6J31_01180, partial [Thermoguttaceae bacterium]|nr:hypothetical protein [Thermoguttaceae bacterium]
MRLAQRYGVLAHICRIKKRQRSLRDWLWEAARLASLFKKFLSIGGAALGGGASRVAFQESPLLRRGGSGRRRVSRLWEATRLASLFKKFH